MIKGDNKGVGNRHMWFSSIIGSGEHCNRHYTSMVSHRKCMVKFYIDRKYYVRHLNKNIFSGTSSTTNKPNFKIVYNSIHKLLAKCFEDPAQHVHIIASRVNNKRGECLTLYRPVIDDCAEVKRLPFRVTYRVLVFVCFLTAISLAAP